MSRKITGFLKVSSRHSDLFKYLYLNTRYILYLIRYFSKVSWTGLALLANRIPSHFFRIRTLTNRPWNHIVHNISIVNLQPWPFMALLNGLVKQSITYFQPDIMKKVLLLTQKQHNQDLSRGIRCCIRCT